MLTTILPILGTVIVVLVTQYDFFSKRRNNILKDVEIYKALPNDSTAKQTLLLHIDIRVKDLVKDERVKRRDPAGVIAALAVLAVAGYVGWLAFRNGGWWFFFILPALFLFILGLTGLVSSLKKQIRRSSVSRSQKSPFEV